MGRTLGLKSTRKRYPDTNDILEKAYKSKIAGKKSASQQEEILRLSHELEMPERKIERWLRQRAMAGKVIREKSHGEGSLIVQDTIENFFLNFLGKKNYIF